MLQRLLLLLLLLLRRGAAAAALFGNDGGCGAGALQRLIAFWHGTSNGLGDTGPLQLRLHLQCAQVGAATEAGRGAATAATAAAAAPAGVGIGCAAKELIKVPVTQEFRFVASRLRRVRGGSRFL